MQCLSYGLSFYQFIAFSFIGELCSLFNAVCFILLLSLAFIYLCLLCYFLIRFWWLRCILFALLFLYLFSLFCLFIILVACSWLFICVLLCLVSAWVAWCFYYFLFFWWKNNCICKEFFSCIFSSVMLCILCMYVLYIFFIFFPGL